MSKPMFGWPKGHIMHGINWTDEQLKAFESEGQKQVKRWDDMRHSALVKQGVSASDERKLSQQVK